MLQQLALQQHVPVPQGEEPYDQQVPLPRLQWSIHTVGDVCLELARHCT